jgi:hypothetical protein
MPPLAFKLRVASVALLLGAALVLAPAAGAAYAAPATPFVPATAAHHPAPGPGPDLVPAPSSSTRGHGGRGASIAREPGGGEMPHAEVTGDGSSWAGWSSWFDVPGLVSKALASFLALLIRQAEGPVLHALASTVLATPDVTANPGLVRLWWSALEVTAGGCVLFVLVGGLTVMGYETVQTRYALRQIAPRFVLGLAASVASLTVMGKTTVLANAVSAAILGRGVSPHDAAAELATAITHYFLPRNALYLLALQVCLLTLMVGVLAGYVLRTALVYLLAVCAPPALACHMHPVTDGVARLWWRAWAGCLVMQAAQAVTLLVGLKLFFAPGTATARPGLPWGHGLGDVLAAVCLFWVLWKIPGWTARMIFRSTPVSLPGTPMPVRMLRSLALAYVLRGATPLGRRNAPSPQRRSPVQPRRPGPPPTPPPGGPGTTPPAPGGPSTAPPGSVPGPNTVPPGPGPTPTGGGPTAAPAPASTSNPPTAPPAPGTGTKRPAPSPRPTAMRTSPRPPATGTGPGPQQLALPVPARKASAPPTRPASRQPAGPRPARSATPSGQLALPIPAPSTRTRPPRPVQLALPLEPPPGSRRRKER